MGLYCLVYEAAYICHLSACNFKSLLQAVPPIDMQIIRVAQKRYFGKVPLSTPMSGHVGFVVDKVSLGQAFSEHFCFPCQFYLFIIRGWYSRPSSGRLTKCTQAHPPPHIKYGIICEASGSTQKPSQT
jgi:hypothetical protein